MCTAWRMWNDPKDTMPPPCRKVLVAYRNSLNNLRRTTAEYITPRTIAAEDFFDYHESNKTIYMDIDEYGYEWVREGWYEMPEFSEDADRIYEDILAWIELPELPCDWRE